ncbi:MAG: methionyl-tRNA formyltransferase [Clostridia bacterium]|nr:methionyl-tRNA formyltransferase [Clostridia bacterium]
MKILFMGTPDYAHRILEALADSGEEIVGVLTQPDKPKGRGHKIVMSPVKEYALEKGIPVFQPQTLRDGAFKEDLEKLSPEMIVVAAYGKILPPYVIDYPEYGCINAHASILPKYRGASPIQRAIMAGETETGVTAMYMDEGLDTGDVILCEKVVIGAEDDFETVHDALAEAGCRAILKTVALAKEKRVPRTPQNGAESTYAEKITKDDRLIDFTKSAAEIHNRIRALSPFPRAFTQLPDGKLLQIMSSRIGTPDRAPEVVPGTVVVSAKEGFFVRCGDGYVQILEVIPEGKGKMSASDFARGRKIADGDVLGTSDNDAEKD